MNIFPALLIALAVLIDSSIQETPVTKENKAKNADGKVTLVNEVSPSLTAGSTSQKNANDKTPSVPAAASTDEDTKEDPAVPDAVNKKALDSSTDGAPVPTSPAEPNSEQQQLPQEHIHDTNKKCPSVLCKIVPADAVCKPLPENPAVSVLGSLGDCCPFYVCFRKDGSFFAHFAGIDMDRGLGQEASMSNMGPGQMQGQFFKMQAPFVPPPILASQNRFAEFTSVSSSFGAPALNNNNRGNLAFLIPEFQSNFMARRIPSLELQPPQQTIMNPQEIKPQSFQRQEQYNNRNPSAMERGGSPFPNFIDGFRDRRNIAPQPMVFNRNPVMNPFLQPGFPDVFQPFQQPRPMQS